MTSGLQTKGAREGKITTTAGKIGKRLRNEMVFENSLRRTGKIYIFGNMCCIEETFQEEGTEWGNEPKLSKNRNVGKEKSECPARTKHLRRVAKSQFKKEGWS